MTPSEIAAAKVVVDLDPDQEGIGEVAKANRIRWRSDLAPALLSALEEAERWKMAVADGLGYVNRAEGQSGYEVAEPEVILDAFRFAESRADALQAEVHRLTRERVEDSDGWIDSMRATLKELDEARARADAAWRAALEAAAAHIRAWALRAYSNPDPRLAEEILALPPPSATPTNEEK